MIFKKRKFTNFYNINDLPNKFYLNALKKSFVYLYKCH